MSDPTGNSSQVRGNMLSAAAEALAQESFGQPLTDLPDEDRVRTIQTAAKTVQAAWDAISPNAVYWAVCGARYPDMVLDVASSEEEATKRSSSAPMNDLFVTPLFLRPTTPESQRLVSNALMRQAELLGSREIVEWLRGVRVGDQTLDRTADTNDTTP